MTKSTDDSLDTPVWGATEIAKILKRSERATYRLLEEGHVDAERLGHQWVSTKRRLLRRIAGPGEK
jgi:hypothetical protein